MLPQINIVIYILIILVVILLFNNNSEHLTTMSNESIQTLSSVYNTSNLTTTNAVVTGALTAGSINVTGTFNLLPTGIIVAWTGSAVPAGWLLCDGTNKTPDLRGRFILGSGDGTGLTSRKIGDIGGNETQTLTIGQIPTHSHTFSGDDGVGAAGFSIVSNFPYDATSKGAGNGHVYNSGNTGGNQSHAIMPPYYSLAYLMKS
jgi:microcystin-dependent protein